MKRQPTRAQILASTRKAMTAGNFRPSAKEIVHADGFSQRAIHLHFPTLDALYRAAVDADTAEAIVNQLPSYDHRLLALTVVLGRVP